MIESEASVHAVAPAVVADSAARPAPTVTPLPAHDNGLALKIIAAIALAFALQWAQNFFIPVIVAILFTYTLNPVVNWLADLRLSRVIATTVVMAVILGGAAIVAQALSAEVLTVIDELPQTVSKFSSTLSSLRRGPNPRMRKIEETARQIEKVTSLDAAPQGPPSRVVVERTENRLRNYLVAGSLGVASLLSQSAMVLFLVFFLLVAGDTFKRKLVRLTGPSLSSKKITVQLLDDINVSIQRFMFMLLVTNLLLVLSTWGAFRWLGLENAGAWAAAAGLLHLIPYFGPMLIAVATALVAFMQFQSLSMALLVAGSSIAVATLISTFVTTWMTGRLARMNSPAVFLALLFFAWLWGIWGMLLALPIIVVVKVVSQHIEGLAPLAEMLGD